MPKPVDLTGKLSSWQTPSPADTPGAVEPAPKGKPRPSAERRLRFDAVTVLTFCALTAALLAQGAVMWLGS